MAGPLWLLLVMTSLPLTLASVEIPGISSECYAKPGDVILGHVISIRNPTPDQQCGDTVQAMHIEALEAFVYAIDRINANSSILPNITLGFVTLDTCDVYRMALGQSLYFIPNDDTLSPQDVAACTDDEKYHYDVIAVVGDRRSRVVLPMALSMTSAEIPVISTYPTSDELTDDSRFGYFLSLSPPDKYQTEAILQLLSHFNWTYFSLIFSDGSYGENGGKQLQLTAPSYGICIENVFMIFADLAELNLKEAIGKLQSSVSRVVVFFAEDIDISLFFQLIPESMYNQYIWIGSDGASIRTYGAGSNGLISVHHEFGTSEEFEDYFRALTPVDNTDNPWFAQFWEDIYGCEWNVNTNCTENCEVVDCARYEHSPLPDDMELYGWPVKWIDAVDTLAHGLDQLVRETCPEAMMDSTLLQACINGPKYLEYIKQVSFDGLMGPINFDERGEIDGHYLIKQYSATENRNKIIAVWRKNGGLTVHEDLIDWDLYQIGNTNENDEVEVEDNSMKIPESVCSKPCLPKQYIIQKEVTCCWQCLYCRENEILTENRTSCKKCEENTWPDDESATVCELIPSTYLRFSSDSGAALLTFASAGILLTILIAIYFIRCRDAPLIKASSKSLMAIILTGILMAFLSVFCILAPPVRTTCFLKDFGFSVSVTAIYAPLLIKTIRIYRIFNAGGSGKSNLRLISNRSQFALSLALILLQIVITETMEIASPSQPVLQMPISTEKYSELFCSSPLESMLIPLCYNLVLLIICAIFGFMNRKMPENFNESWFIFISVSTTSFIWVVFLPIYFTTFYAYHRSTLLSTSLLLNGLITSVCLFVPKMYAVKFVTPSEMVMASNIASVNTVEPALQTISI